MPKSTEGRRFRQVSVLFLLSALLTCGSAFAGSFEDIIVFGDSLSDSGNIFAVTQGAVPPQPYFMGRFTNGLNYADRLGEALDFPLVPSLVGGTNFAFGGARTDSHPSGQPFSLFAQLERFKASGYPVSEQTLVIVFGGANNLQDIIFAAATDPLNAFTLGVQGVENAVADLRRILDELAASGVKHLLVPNAPDLGLVPRVTEQQAAAPWIVPYARFVTVLFNLKLAGVLHTLDGVQVYRFDTFRWLRDAVADPQQYGLNNVTERCYTGDDLTFPGGGEVCDNPDDYLFWDGIHPTRVVHEFIAEDMVQILRPQKRHRPLWPVLFRR